MDSEGAVSLANDPLFRGALDAYRASVENWTEGTRGLSIDEAMGAKASSLEASVKAAERVVYAVADANRARRLCVILGAISRSGN